ncbi:nucleotide exchange factor GrpE [Candidatus Shapirobacteria bacterium]|nr:nucleotide exchange factor GrpE [Candidatus Shapirobacteria bacterium]
MEKKQKKERKNLSENEKIVALGKKIEEIESQWKRALADYQNLEKRVAREQEDFIRFANERLLDKILNVFDNLERACRSREDRGLEMIKDEFWEVLTSEGIEKIETNGATFDPYLMDALELVPGRKNYVVEEVSPGYLYRGKCLRPARVKVGNGEKR